MKRHFCFTAAGAFFFVCVWLVVWPGGSEARREGQSLCKRREGGSFSKRRVHTHHHSGPARAGAHAEAHVFAPLPLVRAPAPRAPRVGCFCVCARAPACAQKKGRRSKCGHVCAVMMMWPSRGVCVCVCVRACLLLLCCRGCASCCVWGEACEEVGAERERGKGALERACARALHTHTHGDARALRKQTSARECVVASARARGGPKAERRCCEAHTRP